jgi:aspartate ammonia-lyase
MRKERDFLGSVDIPDERFYGINTMRALENFGQESERHDPLFITAYL